MAAKTKKAKVSMTKAAFVKEHKHLVKTLKTGSRAALKREALAQSKELKRVSNSRKGK